MTFGIMKPMYYYTIILGVISLFILVSTLHYLNELEKCKCFYDSQMMSKYKVDIDFLKAYQILEMFLLVIFVFIIMSRKSQLTSGVRNGNILLTNVLFPMVLILLLFVGGYISFNSFLLFIMSREKCRCVDRWQKYFIYMQGALGYVSVLRIVYTISLVLFLIIFQSN